MAALVDTNGLVYVHDPRSPEVLSEDFQHGARYGSVTVVNPFL